VSGKFDARVEAGWLVETCEGKREVQDRDVESHIVCDRGARHEEGECSRQMRARRLEINCSRDWCRDQRPVRESTRPGFRPKPLPRPSRQAAPFD